jgi:hypothetical protein
MLSFAAFSTVIYFWRRDLYENIPTNETAAHLNNIIEAAHCEYQSLDKKQHN